MSDMDRKIKSDESRLTWIGGAIIIAAIFITGLVSWLLYEHTVNLLTDNLRQRLLSIATTQAANISYQDLEELQTERDWKKPQWTKVVKQLKNAKDNNTSIVFMYVFRKQKDDPSKMVFVADAESINPYANTDADNSNDVDANGDGKVEPDGADQLQWPGQDYPEPPSETFEAYNGPLTSAELYEDSYGQVLTGYAPIKDNHGNVVAVLATDIKANDFLVVTRQTLFPFLLFIIFLVLAIVFLSFLLIKLWNKRIELFAELDRQKDELLGIVAHQLAKPITAIRWNLESLYDGDLGQLNDKQKEEAVTMRTQAVNLADLVSMILDVSRIQLGKINLEPLPLDLNAFFKEILDVIEPTVKQKKINFVKKMPSSLPTALLDKRYTRMTIENLLTNAVKYTPEGGTVTLDLKIDNGVLRCSVADTGMGIPKAEQDKIFGKMYRASNVRNTVEGNGFGLYVAKGAIEGQGGKLTFTSTEGKGTTFYCELPLKEPTKK